MCNSIAVNIFPAKERGRVRENERESVYLCICVCMSVAVIVDKSIFETFKCADVTMPLQETKVNDSEIEVTVRSRVFAQAYVVLRLVAQIDVAGRSVLV